MRRVRSLSGVMAALGALAFFGCGDFGRTAGGTSDTDNAVVVAGTTLAPDGVPAAGDSVRLRRSDYLSPFPALGKVVRARAKVDTVTDPAGRFRLDSHDNGS
jgi:hypothetical protein